MRRLPLSATSAHPVWVEFRFRPAKSIGFRFGRHGRASKQQGCHQATRAASGNGGFEVTCGLTVSGG